MRKLVWAVVLLATLLLMGAKVGSQEKTSQPAYPQVQGMGPMMGMGMMGKGGEMDQMGQGSSMMPMMEGMMRMMDGCARMMASPSPAPQGGNK